MGETKIQEQIRNTTDYKKRERFVLSEIHRRLTPKGYKPADVTAEIEAMVDTGELLRRGDGYVSRSASGRLLSQRWVFPEEDIA